MSRFDRNLFLTIGTVGAIFSPFLFVGPSGLLVVHGLVLYLASLGLVILTMTTT